MTETWEYGGDRDPAVDTTSFPWPPPENGPVVAALGATWKGATFDPGRFFADTPREGGTGAALIYYLLLGILVAGATLFWESMAFMAPAAEDSLAAALRTPTLQPITRFLLAPAILLFALYVSAGVVHVLLLIFGGARHGFDTTVRVFCYAYSPALFGVVPTVGTLVGGIWSVVVLIIGLREAHEADGWKPAVAVLVPLVGLVILFTLAAMFVLAVGAGLPGA